MSKQNRLPIPQNGHVLISPVATKIGNFYVADADKGKPQVGEVIALSDKIDQSEYDEKVSWDTDVKVGDQVIYKSYSGTEWENDGKKYSFVKFRDIVGII